MSGHRRRDRSRRSSESWSSGRRSTSSSYMHASTTETDDDDMPCSHRRRLKRPSASFPVRRRSPASREPSWVVLSNPGADRTPTAGSAMSCTSTGEDVSVSFRLVEPVEYSALTVDWTRPSSTPTRPNENVLAAHRDVVLLAIEWDEDNPPRSVLDLFVYHQAPSRLPSLLLLPSYSAAAGGPEIYSHRFMIAQEFGIMSSASNDDDSPSFVIAHLQMGQGMSSVCSVCVFRSASGQWESFENLDVRGADGHGDLCYWSADAALPYGRRCMIWVDYYRGMVLMDMYSWGSQSSEKKLPPPRLRYVPLPVDRVGSPVDMDFGGRGRPKAFRRVCVTRHGVKFVSIDTQLWSNFGIGNRDMRSWSHRFRITTWSQREDSDDYTWRKEATMHEQEFWDALNGGDRLGFPYIEPEFPVVDVENPDVVFFRLEGSQEPKWMIEVDLRKKVVRAATVYSEEEGDAEAINSARVSHYDTVTSELPSYMDQA